MPGQLNPRQELDGVLDRQGVGSGYRSQLLGNFEDWAAGIARAGLDQDMDRLYTAVRDHKAAYEAAVGVIQRQNEQLARVRALHRKATHGDDCVYCVRGNNEVYDVTWPCDTVQALDA